MERRVRGKAMRDLSKYWSVLLPIALLILLASCGQDDGMSGGPSTSLPGGAGPTEVATGQIKAPHFVDSFPAHDAVFASAPRRVVVSFDFDLDERSSIDVTKDGVAVTAGASSVAEDRLSLATPVQEQGQGEYLVVYAAFWPDGSSHEGRFSYRVSPEEAADYEDLTGQSQVTISMNDLRFDPERVMISRGATVTWVNDEGPEHYVNSDPHPSHNAWPELNSRALARGETYSFNFDEVGEWSYHCSAHFPQMTGRILVRDDGKLPDGSVGADGTAADGGDEAGTTTTSAAATEADLGPERKSPHFVESTPDHGSRLEQAPTEVVLRFNFDLHEKSTVRVVRDGTEVTAGPAAVAADKLNMRVSMLPSTGSGIYVVDYNACWPDGSCHEGRLAFLVD